MSIHDVDAYEDLRCSVCHDIPGRGVVRCSNRHLTCLACEARLSAKTCPCCRVPLSPASDRALDVEESVRNTLARCVGCFESMTLREVIEHEPTCERLPVRCEHGSCEWTGSRRAREAHLSRCAWMRNQAKCRRLGRRVGNRWARRTTRWAVQRLSHVDEKLDDDMRTLLCVAAEKDDARLAAMLIDTKGAHVNVTTARGFTPLHFAVVTRSDSVADILLARAEVDVDIPDAFGRTPLHLAVKEANVHAVRGLVARDADVFAEDDEGVSPIILVSKNGYTSDVDRLIIFRILNDWMQCKFN